MGIKINKVSMKYDKFEAVQDICIDVAEGTIHGLIGENGSGKTTLIKCIMGIYKPEKGEVLVDGENVYASVQTYVTKDDAKYESHRRYIDIQYMIDGEEKIGVTDLSNCVSCVEYDSEKDLELLE